MLQIHEFTEAHLATLTPRSQKHGDDEVPAVSLGLELTVGNTLLDAIDPAIREALFKRVDGQPDLPGVESSTPVLRCNSIDRVTLPTKYEGWTLEVDDGIDDATPKAFGSCKIDKFSVEPKQGGSCLLRIRIGTSDLDAERSGMLGMHVGQSIWIKLRAPEKAQDQPAGSDEDEDDDQPDATDLFVNSAGDEHANDDAGADQRAPTEADIFPGAQDNKAVVPITTKRRRKGIGTDAEQAERQAQVLAQDSTQVADWPFPGSGPKTPEEALAAGS